MVQNVLIISLKHHKIERNLQSPQRHGHLCGGNISQKPSEIARYANSRIIEIIDSFENVFFLGSNKK